jgi:hypothetical protein
VTQLAGLAPIGPGAGAFEWVDDHILLVTIEG